MKNIARKLSALLLVFVVSAAALCPAFAATASLPSLPSGQCVVDDANVLSSSTVQTIQDLNTQLDASCKGAQIGVLTVDYTGSVSTEDYAVEAANTAVMLGAEQGVGKPGMGCTASCCLIEEGKMAIAHVGDSRIYLLRHGSLVRVTHDHSYVEELVDSGQITADEARTHPSRSIITRALGSDPDMYADHFSLEVSNGDRVILCSDGLSSMIADSEIEALAVSSATPQQAADNLVAAALTAGGLDNVTVVVVDVVDDGTAEKSRRRLTKRAIGVTATLVGVLLATVLVCLAFVRGEWYLSLNGDTVGIYQGINASVLGIPLGNLVETSAVAVADLPASVQDQLEQGIRVANEQAGRDTLDAYRAQIDADKTAAASVADEAKSEGNPGAPVDTAPTTPENGGE